MIITGFVQLPNPWTAKANMYAIASSRFNARG
jgi:hypothetical protein